MRRWRWWHRLGFISWKAPKPAEEEDEAGRERSRGEARTTAPPSREDRTRRRVVASVLCEEAARGAGGPTGVRHETVSSRENYQKNWSAVGAARRRDSGTHTGWGESTRGRVAINGARLTPEEGLLSSNSSPDAFPFFLQVGGGGGTPSSYSPCRGWYMRTAREL